MDKEKQDKQNPIFGLFARAHNTFSTGNAWMHLGTYILATSELSVLCIYVAITKVNKDMQVEECHVLNGGLYYDIMILQLQN